MRTVFISFYQAFPPCSGAASVTYYCARYLPGERILIQLADDTSEATTPDGVGVYTLPWPVTRLAKLWTLRRRIREIADICQQVRPDVVILEGASWIVYHWRLLRELRRRIAAPIVYHSHNVDYHLRRQRNGRLVAAITKWAEGIVVREADLVFAVSAVDQLQMENLYGRRPDLLPNAVDTARFATVSEESREEARRRYRLGSESVLFMGLYEYPPNTEAVEALVRVIFPRVLRRHPEATLVLLGGTIPHNKPWILAPGRIPYEELPAVVAACRLGVVPIFSGSGTRLKILECLAARLPVVSTPKGAEGLELSADQHLRIAADLPSLADAIIELLEDPQTAARLAEAGQRAVGDRYSMKAIMSSVGKLLQSRLFPSLNRRPSDNAGPAKKSPNMIE